MDNPHLKAEEREMAAKLCPGCGKSFGWCECNEDCACAWCLEAAEEEKVLSVDAAAELVTEIARLRAAQFPMLEQRRVSAMDNLTAEERKMAERCRYAATGPWIADTNDHMGENWLIASFGNSQIDGKDHIVTTDHVRCSEFNGDAGDDAEFVAHARQDIPALLETVATLRAELAQVKAEREAELVAAKVEALREAAAVCEAHFYDCDKSNVACHKVDAETIRSRADKLEKPTPHCLCEFAVPGWDGVTHDRRCHKAETQEEKP